MPTIALGAAIQRGVVASRPASGDATKAGQLYYATDEGRLYHDNGTAWLLVATNLAVGTDVEAHDADLTAIAGLTPSNDDVIQRKAGAWSSRTLAQLIADLIAVGAWTEAVQDVIGAMVAAAGGSYDDAAGTITLPSGGGGAALTVEEVDGSPTDSAVTKIVFPNGTLTIVGHVATFTPTGGGGAPTTVPYVTTASDATLSAEIAIPGLAASPDIAGLFGAGVSDEFDSGSSGLTWTSSPTSEDVNTTVPSHLHLATSGTGEMLGYKSWTPGGDFDIRAKLQCNGLGVVGLIVMDATNANRLLVQFNASSGLMQAYNYSGGYGAVGGSPSYPGLSPVYARIKRVGTTATLYYSANGYLWLSFGTTTFSAVVARRGFRIDAAVGGEYICDWMRADV